MKNEDLATISRMGRALWGDPERSRQAATETMTAVSLLEVAPDRKLERVAAVLLERANREGTASIASANLALLASPFYRLEPRERFLLVALHGGRWSYARLARVMRTPAEEIEILAWSARTRLAGPGKYPSGAAGAGTNCPEYDARKPWTQKFLDDELPSGSPRIFLRNHLMVCEGCRVALNRCRDFYYAVEAMLPIREAGTSDEVADLERIQALGDSLRPDHVVTFGESLRIFFARPRVRLVVGALAFWCALKWLA